MRPLVQSKASSAVVVPDAVDRLLSPISIRIWRGASGRRYAHTAYHLLGCPEFTSAVWLLVRRDGRERHVLGVGYAECDVASLNLAAVRQRGAMLGANEVHIHDLAATTAERAQIAFDLEAALPACRMTAAPVV